MRVLIDMNLSPRWVSTLNHAGHHAVHWSTVGAPDAPDATVMARARNEGYLVFTLDLDFTALLASTQARGPSVLQVRAQDVLPEAIGPAVLAALHRFERELQQGALVSLDPSAARVRILPLRT